MGEKSEKEKGDKKRKKTRIAAVGDIHVRESDRGKWKDYFRTVSEKADVLLLCGDLTDTGHAREAVVLAEELTACTIPVIGVLGNHDYEADEHVAIREATVEGEPEAIMPFLGSSRLVEPINRRQVVAAFHGHAHYGTLEGETSAGVKIFNVSKPILQRAGYETPFYLLEV
jgi:Icc-related predicted phosphoesterase